MATSGRFINPMWSIFQSTPPSRVATWFFLLGNSLQKYFNPHHPRGWRQKRKVRLKTYQIFQSTPPSRVATFPALYRCFALAISIHTTLAGGDKPHEKPKTGCRYFNPHHPRGWRRQMVRTIERTQMISIHTTLAGGDLGLPGQHRSTPTFQSTPPSRVATWYPIFDKSCLPYFNPHHPRGWRLALPRLVMPFSLEFQSTPPSRVATDFRFILRVNVLISIHTTLAGGDRMLTLIPRSTKSHFNPHHPRGWRPEARIYAATRL